MFRDSLYLSLPNGVPPSGSACCAATLASITFVQSPQMGRTWLDRSANIQLATAASLFFHLLYIELPSLEIERAERVNALPHVGS